MKVVLVQKDGKITLKLIGEIQAAGETLKELEDRIVKELSKYVSKPSVSVTLKEFGKRKIFVMGQMKTVGEMEYKDGMKLMEVLSLAGGITDKADLFKVKIFRGTENKTVQEINAYALLNEGDMSKNIDIQVGDIIYVPQKGETPFDWFNSNVMPGLYIFSTILTIYILLR